MSTPKQMALRHNQAVIDGAYLGQKLGEVINEEQTLLLLVDFNTSFVNGELQVPGAHGDVNRTVAFVRKYGRKLDSIAVTLDEHVGIAIHSQLWWEDAQSHKNVAPFTVVSLNADGVFMSQDGREIRPRYMPEWSKTYLTLLSEAKKELVIWPPHCQRNTRDWLLYPDIADVVAWHESLHGYQSVQIHKGLFPTTEHYSALRPEITPPGYTPEEVIDWAFIRYLNAFDRIVVAGEALSHCVLSTIEDMVALLEKPKIFVLRDCASIIPRFEDQTWTRLSQLKQAGVELVYSTEADKLFGI